MRPSVLRVGLDLDGSLDSFGGSLLDLAVALADTGECEVVRFHTRAKGRVGESRPWVAPLARPLWRRGLGPAIDRFVGPIDVVHVAERATPPTRSAPLVVSVDDLRPLRPASRVRARVTQLQRAVDHGALLVASSMSASREIRAILNVAPSRVVVVPPIVPRAPALGDGSALIVNLTGTIEPFLELAPSLLDFIATHHTRLVVVASAKLGQQLRARGLGVEWRPRERALEALGEARALVHVSDGARFPSVPVAALSSDVPVVARETAMTREVLGDAAVLVEDHREVTGALEELWERPARRALLVAAGRDRAGDFAAERVARAYGALYREVVRGWRS